MKRPLIACLSLACAVGAGACSDRGNGGGPAMLPDPGPSEPTSSVPTAVDGGSVIGTEPSSSGIEPTGGEPDPMPGATLSLSELCARACAHVQSMCPNALGGPDCVSECIAASEDPCMVEFAAVVACLGRAPFMCIGDSLDIPECDPVLEDFIQCTGTFTGGG